MYIRQILAMSVVALAFPLIAAAQETVATASVQNAPDFSLVVLGYFDADTLADFHRRVQQYDELRRVVERTGATLGITGDADEITGFERWLTARIRERRGSSARGQIIPAPMAAQLKKLFHARVDADTLEAIMDDAPGEFDVDVNETYDNHRSLATMPPNILLLLPDLADEWNTGSSAGT
jgi:predicted phosphoribosyltransferase